MTNKETFFKVKEFSNKKNRIPMAYSKNKYEKFLGLKCTRIRKMYKENKLSEEDIKMFENNSLWFWDNNNKKELEIKRIICCKENKNFKEEYDELNLKYDNLSKSFLDCGEAIYLLHQDIKNLKDILEIKNKEIDDIKIENDRMKYSMTTNSWNNYYINRNS